MSNTKKNWNASKASRRSADANKKTLKVLLAEKKQTQKKSQKK